MPYPVQSIGRAQRGTRLRSTTAGGGRHGDQGPLNAARPQACPFRRATDLVSIAALGEATLTAAADVSALTEERIAAQAGTIPYADPSRPLNGTPSAGLTALVRQDSDCLPDERPRSHRRADTDGAFVS
jgi:hypothetical protein